jgi:Holliday junction DNA helicase RuvA
MVAVPIFRESVMIGKLKGIVDAIGESHCVIDVNGVGYEVQASARTLRNMKLGEPASLAIDTHVREDAIRLYGFASEVERSWFRTLQNVQGVGSKVALGVLGTLSPTDLANAIALGDWAAVERSPGVGKKLAQRITLELKDKAPALSVAGLNVPVASANGASIAAARVPEGNAVAEAISALSNLGYQPAQASQAVAAAMKELGAEADTARLIRRGLRELAR